MFLPIDASSGLPGASFASDIDQSRIAPIASPSTADPMWPPGDYYAHNRVCDARFYNQLAQIRPESGKVTTVLCRSCNKSRSGVLPAEQDQEFRQHHRGCSPDFDPRNVECRNNDRPAVADAFGARDAGTVEQIVKADVDNASNLAVRRHQGRPLRESRDNRVKPEPADGNVERSQRAQDADILDRQADLFVRLAQRGLHDALARLDDPSRERDLSTVPSELLGADGQQDVRSILSGKQQQQASRGTDVLAVKARRPLTRRARRHERVRGCARQIARKSRFESREDLREDHSFGAVPCSGPIRSCTYLFNPSPLNRFGHTPGERHHFGSSTAPAQVPGVAPDQAVTKVDNCHAA